MEGRVGEGAAVGGQWEVGCRNGDEVLPKIRIDDYCFLTEIRQRGDNKNKQQPESRSRPSTMPPLSSFYSQTCVRECVFVRCVCAYHVCVSINKIAADTIPGKNIYVHVIVSAK